MLTPVLALVVWTLIIWVWMMALRIPAMKKAQVDPQKAVHAGALRNLLPTEVSVAADNYNHLFEQPVLFYALMVYSHLAGVSDPLNVALAWGYVALRIVHSFIQIIVMKVMPRFIVFAISMAVLMVIALRNVYAYLTL